MTKHLAIVFAIMLATSLALSVIWQVPYIYTATGFAGWIFGGHLVTIDDDWKNGWSNPDGAKPFPWSELLIKASIFGGLLLACFASPAIRQFGG